MWKARAVQWQNAGIPIETVAPKEGIPMYVSGFVMPKNAPNKPLAYKYLNAMLEPAAQRAFAEKMGYLPTVNDAPLSGKVGEQLALPEGVNMLSPDYSIVGKLQGPTSEWWKNKSFRPDSTNPKPRSATNLLTLPCAIAASLEKHAALSLLRSKTGSAAQYL